MRRTGDVGRGASIGPRLSGWGSRDSVLPRGFPAVARIFHPGLRTRWAGPVDRPGSTRRSQRPVSWAEVAALTGTVAHPWMQWGDGALSDLAAPGWAAAAGLGRGIGDDGVPAPQLLWPSDRAWCLATEIDFGFTLLGGDAELVDAVLRHTGLEAAALERDGDLGRDGDTRNLPASDDR